jgi:tetratricopeptide (TPR) repeat protein
MSSVVRDEEAKGQFALAVRRDSPHEEKAGVHETIAWRWFLRDKPSEGLVDAERAVAFAPVTSTILDTRGQIYLALSRIDEAFADLDRAISSGYTQGVGTWYARGRVYELKGNRSAAISDYRHAIEMQARNEYERSASAKARERLTALGAPETATPSTSSRLHRYETQGR